MNNPDWNLQVKIGNGHLGKLSAGRTDTGAHHRAITIAQQLLASGRWPDCLNTCIVIHDVCDTHRRLQMSGTGKYHAPYNVIVYPGVHDLLRDRDYEIHPLTDSFRQNHNV